MKFSLLVLVMLCISFNQNFAQEVKNDEEQLRYLKEVEWPKAYYEQDTMLLDRILAEEFQMIDANGNSFTKQDELDYIKKNKHLINPLNMKLQGLISSKIGQQ